jgi:hypothetical protein
MLMRFTLEPSSRNVSRTGVRGRSSRMSTTSFASGASTQKMAVSARKRATKTTYQPIIPPSSATMRASPAYATAAIRTTSSQRLL